MVTIALFGAAGAMGTRVSQGLRDDPDYRILHVEAGESGMAKLRARGVEPVAREAACAEADVALLAVPDHLIGPVANDVVPLLRSGTLVMCLDPAAPYAGLLPERDDVAYFVTHPGHPPIFNDETDPEARRDYWGHGKAKQAIVSALAQGTDADYELGERISARIFRPILRSHRVTVEQMAIMEPALSETVAATCITIIREAMDEAVKRGVPEEAARDFLLGHITIPLAIVFGEIDWQFSAGAQMAIADAKERLFRADWKDVFTPEEVRASVARIVRAKPR